MNAKTQVIMQIGCRNWEYFVGIEGKNYLVNLWSWYRVRLNL
jgi:hypothetical protein